MTLPDGNVKNGTSFETTPLDIAKAISNSLAKTILVSKVKFTGQKVGTLDEGLKNPEEEGSSNDGWQWYDARRPLEGSCHIKLFPFNSVEGKETFWHSSAHVLGETLEVEFGVHLTHGPPTDQGFFYDSFTGKDVSLPLFFSISFTLILVDKNLRKNTPKMTCL